MQGTIVSSDARKPCVAVNLKKERMDRFEYEWEDEQKSGLLLADQVKSYLYEPYASVMKAGAFKILTQRFDVRKLGVSSHLYTSDSLIEDFPGRRFKVDSCFTMNKQQLKEHLSDCRQANVAVRNFPMSAEQLKSKLKLKDGGDVYLFATTFKDQKVILKTKAVS